MLKTKSFKQYVALHNPKTVHLDSHNGWNIGIGVSDGSFKSIGIGIRNQAPYLKILLKEIEGKIKCYLQKENRNTDIRLYVIHKFLEIFFMYRHENLVITKNNIALYVASENFIEDAGL